MWYLVKTMNDKYSIRYHHTEDDNPYCSFRDSSGAAWTSSISDFTHSALNYGGSCSIQYIREELGNTVLIIPLPLITDHNTSIEVFYSTYPELFL